MRGLFWLLALFALAVALALGARMNEGYVLLVFAPWRMELSLNLFILLQLVLAVLVYLFLRGLFLTMDLPRRAREFRRRHHQEQAVSQLHDAIRFLYEGRFSRALKKATEAYETGNEPGLSALVAARAAQRLREPAKEREWIERARQDSRCQAAAWMLKAELANEIGDHDEALHAIRHLQARHGRHIAALRMELRARQGRGDWEGVLRLSRQLHKRRAISEKVAHELNLRAHLEQVRRNAGDVTALLSYLRKVPRAERDSRLAFELARQLKVSGADDEAAEVIEECLEDGREEFWQNDLVALFGALAGTEQTARIARAEKWLLKHPEDAGLLLTLGKLCAQQRLWGKAQSYFEASLALDPTPQAYLELARLFDKLGREDEANRNFRQSIARMF